jgi:hypothetical protein
MSVKGTINLYVPPKYGTDTGRQFEPDTETHHVGFIVKCVDPGCTLEIQIEERSGRVTRITTTENPNDDWLRIREAILDAADRFLDEFGICG